MQGLNWAGSHQVTDQAVLDLRRLYRISFPASMHVISTFTYLLALSSSLKSREIPPTMHQISPF